ncbi:hypothetical protein HMPREF0868_0271 [Mageeibacillus indolicus UPII9-5]|uniref:Uncharacterized protein n=1 Tax=Mageeibacillus indolicus (strain UPII9-5) TaxID=699246 RepID=D3R0A2_MAGIU|nr:hypothetical protein HMPREF0868_0271 [Mageeibacillus indolicus UPII9-5]
MGNVFYFNYNPNLFSAYRQYLSSSPEVDKKTSPMASITIANKPANWYN